MATSPMGGPMGGPMGDTAEGIIYPRPIESEALLARIGTGAFTAANIGSSALLIWLELGVSPVTSLTDLLGGLLLPVILFSGLSGYITLCLWMQAARARLVEARYPVTPAWHIWVPWLVPIWTLFGPRKVMGSLYDRVKWGSTTFLNLWWLGWIGYLVADRIARIPDLVGTPLIVTMAIMTGFLVMSYVALQKVITDVSASVTEPARLVPRRPRSSGGLTD